MRCPDISVILARRGGVSGVDFDLRRDEPYLAYEELVGNGVMRVATRAEADALGTACWRSRLVRADGFVADNTRSMQQFPQWISQKKLLAVGGHCSLSSDPGGAAPASSLALWDASASTSRSPR
jgi:hypothetical protein